MTEKSEAKTKLSNNVQIYKADNNAIHSASCKSGTRTPGRGTPRLSQSLNYIIYLYIYIYVNIIHIYIYIYIYMFIYVYI